MSDKFYEKFEKKITKPQKPAKSEKKDKAFESKNKPNIKNNGRQNSFNSVKNSKPVNRLSKSAVISVEKSSTLFADSKVPLDARKIVEDFDSIVNNTHPLNSKQRALLPKQIRELSHYLTDERGQRRMGYMNQTTALSAYVHYYLWWNLVRLTKLFANLPADFFDIEDNNICLDIGSGPLTVPISLFLARPELRNKKITFYCMDISQQALTFGENILMSVAARLECEPWKIVRVKGEFGTSIKDKASFITSANCFNELNEEPGTPPDFLAKKLSDKILSYVDSNAKKQKLLIVEPGFPKSARLVSLLRDALIRKNFMPVSPCPHFTECTMQGKKGEKWCNFCFATDSAPKQLKKLSEASELPKERAVLSFIAVEKMNEEQIAEIEKTAEDYLSFRIASDPIRLPGQRTGYYACSKLGLLLIVTKDELFSGECLKIKMPESTSRKDEKSGAILIEL